MRLAQDCRCENHLVFEAGVCFRSGLLLDAAAVAPERITRRRQLDDATLKLELAIIDTQHALREEASEVLGFELPDAAGEPPETPAQRHAYADWLEAVLA